MNNIECVACFWNEIINNKDISKVDEIMSQSYIQHAAGIGQGPEGFKEFFNSILSESKGMHAKVLRIETIDDLVMCRTLISFEISPPGWQKENEIIDIFRVRDGQLQEHWEI